MRNLTIVEKAFFGTSMLVVLSNGSVHTVLRDNRNYKEIVDAVNNNDGETFLKLLEESEVSLEKAIDGLDGFVIKEDGIYVDGYKLPNALSVALNKMVDEKQDLSAMKNFVRNLMENPSYNSQQHLFNFLEKHEVPMTPDGCFLAYKSVRSDYKDKHSGTIDNSVGQVVKLKRATVDDDVNSHCSSGLHAGGYSYAGPGGWFNNPGDKVVIVKINPKDVVCVPNDHSFAKLRVCEYKVVGECTAQFKKSVVREDNLYDDRNYTDEWRDDYEDEWDDDGLWIPCRVEDLKQGVEIQITNEDGYQLEGQFVTFYDDTIYMKVDGYTEEFDIRDIETIRCLLNP